MSTDSPLKLKNSSLQAPVIHFAALVMYTPTFQKGFGGSFQTSGGQFGSLPSKRFIFATPADMKASSGTSSFNFPKQGTKKTKKFSLNNRWGPV